MLVAYRNAIDGVKPNGKSAEKKAGVAGALAGSSLPGMPGATSANEQFMKYYNKELKVQEGKCGPPLWDIFQIRGRFLFFILML